MPLDYTAPHTPIYARDPASQSVLIQGAMEGHVLVKNVNNSLPLKSPKLLSIFGYDAAAPPAMDIASPDNFLAPFTFGYEPELNYNGFVDTGPAPAFAPNGTMISGGKIWFQLRNMNCIIIIHLLMDNYRWKRRKCSRIYLSTS
jgi:beta-glucosidase